MIRDDGSPKADIGWPLVGPILKLNIVIEHDMCEHSFDSIGSEESSGAKTLTTNMGHNWVIRIEMTYQACRPLPNTMYSGLKDTSW